MATVCQTCGDEGFVEALVYCDSCKIGAVHRYCSGITPVPIDDYITWFCVECDLSDSDSDSQEVDQSAKLRDILKMSEKKKKKNNNNNKGSSNHTQPSLSVDNHELHDTSNVESVEASSSPPITETMMESERKESSDSVKSHESTGLVRNEASVLEAGNGASFLEAGDRASAPEKSEKEKKKRKKKKPVLAVEDQRLQDSTSVELMKDSKKRKNLDSGNSDELTGIVRNEASVLEKSEKKKRKKKKTNKEEKKNDESSNHTSPVLAAEDHGLQDTNRAEAMKEAKKQRSSDSRNSVELTGLEKNEVSVLETNEKKKRKKKKTNKEENNNKESSNHSLLVLDAEDHGLHDTTSVEPMKESEKRKSLDRGNSSDLTCLVRNGVSVLEKSEKKKKKKKKTNKEEKKNEESSNRTSQILAVEDHGIEDTTNVEPEKASSSQPTETTNASKSKRRESPDCGKSHELIGLVKSGASDSEARNSSTVPDHNSRTSNKRRLSSGNIRVTSENTQLATENSSCKEAESNMPKKNERLTATGFNSPALNNDRALPIFKPIWRGSISVKNGNICSIDGLVSHLSSLACDKVHEKASSLQARLSAVMFPRLEIWPDSFLRNGPPTDEDIALYFFPSGESNDEKVYYSLVCEMKKNDLGMRCMLDNVDLLLFTSYQLPLHCWTFQTKEYLWGIFRRRITCSTFCQ